MTPVASRKIDGLSSALRHPRFVVGARAFGAIVALEFTTSLLLGRLT
ncbi:hypothetical protein OF829_20525 [Sphingomonas sp. LB-2]|nr:hypothetical protein [Sphingomonas caeni]MCW3849628.1 hypothetical protein [Sphingomonas caeni]